MYIVYKYNTTYSGVPTEYKTVLKPNKLFIKSNYPATD